MPPPSVYDRPLQVLEPIAVRHFGSRIERPVQKPKPTNWLSSTRDSADEKKRN